MFFFEAVLLSTASILITQGSRKISDESHSNLHLKSGEKIKMATTLEPWQKIVKMCAARAGISGSYRLMCNEHVRL